MTSNLIIKNNLLKLLSLFAFAFIFSLIFNNKIEAAACTWNGSVDNNWSTNGNWDDCTVPTDNDVLIFPFGVDLGSVAMNNDLPSGTFFTSISFYWDAYEVVGNPIDLRGDLLFDDDDNNGALDFELDIHNTFDYLNFIITDANTAIESWGDISGSVDMFKQGDGTLALWGNGGSDYTSHFLVQHGTVKAYSNDSFGDPSAVIDVNDGATVEFWQDVTIPNHFNITGSGFVSPNGPLRNANGSNTLTGTISVYGGYSRLSAAGSTTLTLSGVIDGSTDLYQADTGTIIFSGSDDNSYTGNTIIESGILRLDKTDAFAIPTNLKIQNTATVILNQSYQIDDSVSVEIDGGGLLDYANTSISNDYGDLNINGGRANIAGTSDLYGDVLITNGILGFGGNNVTISTGEVVCNGNSYFQDGNFTTTNTDFTLTKNDNDLNTRCRVLSVWQGSSSITLYGKAIELSASNTFTGTVEIPASSHVWMNNSNGLGNSSAGTTISGDGVLEIAEGINISDPLNLSSGGANGYGGLHSTVGTNTYSGLITLSGSSVFIKNDTSDPLTLSGGITGSISGDLIFASNTIQISGNSTFTSSGGGVSVVDGTLKKTADINAVPDTMNLYTSQYAIFDMNSFSETVGRLDSGLGTVALGSGTLTFGDSSNVTYNGTINGTGNVVKVGSGKQIFSQNMGYTGTTTVSAGTLVVNGTLASSGVTLSGSGTLGGSGTVTAIIASGNAIIAPGNSPGILNVNGNVTFASTNTFAAELNGTTVGSGYDQLNVTGNIALNSMTLNVSLGFTPTIGDTFTIMQATGSISGTFNGLSNNDVFEVSGNSFRIQYGTSSIILTAVNTQTPTPDPDPEPENSGGGFLADTGIRTPLIALALFVAAILASIRFVKKVQRANRPIFR